MMESDVGKDISDWEEKTLGDIVTFQRGHDLPKTKFKGGQYPIIGSNGIIGYHNEFTTKENGITIGRSGSIGNPFFHEEKFWAHNTTLYVREFHNSDPKFVYYFLTQLNFQSLNSGSAVPSLNRNYIHPFPIIVPSLLEQKRIAKTLSCLDSKIENLQQQNQTLEKIAQTLFKQWFVDFNFPDETGKPYKDNGGEMVGSELEKIPKGWEVKGFLDCFDLMSGGTPKTSINEYWDGDIKWISAKDITPNHKKFILNTEKKITNEGLKNSATKLLPKYSVIISARGTVGKYCILSEQMCISQSNYGIKAKKEKIHYYSYLVVANIIRLLKAQAYGSVFDTITTITFKSLQIVQPPEKIIDSFVGTIEMVFDRVLLNTLQIQTLTKTRDTLLPKLMSGQIRIKN
ncbi:MAG: restriction endonuclease subunit S [Pseudomonadota bacterium]